MNFKYALCILLLLPFLACKETSKEKEVAGEEPAEQFVEVVTQKMDFQVADTLQSGWQRFRYKNASPETHFILLERYPEGKSIADTEKEVIPPFQQGMDHILAGESDKALEAFGKLPAWFSEIIFTGGTGMIGPGRVAHSTVYLEPGYYIMECYVKMPDGTFHTAMGMIEPLVVVADTTGIAPPEASVTIEIGSEKGIQVQDSITAGEHVFRVNFKDQKPHEHFVGHDVNLARLEEGASLDSLVAWMDWSQPKGLSTPVPKGVVFLGGMNDLPAGSHGYFTARLDPGRYALIAEVPKADEKGMLYEFEVK